MNPRIKSALLLVVSLAILIANKAVPATAPIWIHALALLLGAAAIIASLLHAPPSVVETIEALLADVSAPPDDVRPAVTRARAIVRRSRALLPFAVLAMMGLAIVGGAAESACTPPPSTPGAISSGATCANDIIQDVATPPTQALLAQTMIDCGLTALAIYQAIQELIAAASPEAGADASALVAGRRGVSIERGVYLAHLRKWSDLAAAAIDGGAR